MLLDLRFLWELAAAILLFGDDSGGAIDLASVLAFLTTDDDPATGTDSAVVLAAPAGSDLGVAGDTTGVSVYATASDDATGGDGSLVAAFLAAADDAGAVDDATVGVLVSITADDSASADDFAEVQEFIPTPPILVGGVRARPRPERTGIATLGDGLRARESGTVSAALSDADASKVWDTATIKRWPDARMVNPVILSMMVAAMED